VRRSKWRETVREIRKHWYAYVFIAPFYINFLIFTVFSIVFSFVVSFADWTGMGPMKMVGLANYRELFTTDVIFREAVGNTAIMMLLDYPAQVILPLIIAVLLSAKTVKAAGVFRTAFYIPNYTSTVVIAFVFEILFMTRRGLVNYALASLGLAEVPWLDDSMWAKVTLVILALWRDLGFRMVIYLAGLQSIPADLYEAAVMDGANAVQAFLKITVPMLRPVIVFVMITTTIGSIQRFIEPLLLTQGGPGYGTYTVLYYLYQRAFVTIRLGYGSAMGYVLFVVIFVFSFLQLKFGASPED
jgi:ABC-type sugar transport system permease subunit